MQLFQEVHYVNFILQWISENVVLAMATGGGLLVLLVSAIVSVAERSIRIYFGALPLIVGTGSVLALWQEVDAESLQIAGCVCAVFGGGIYFVAYMVASFVLIKRKKRMKKEERYRRLQFALPERDNTYIRARLNGALRCESVENDEGVKNGRKTEFSYAKRLLAKLRAADLSATDRLQTDDLGGLLALYDKRERLSSSDLQAVNDCFALLLKLAAKYDVNP